MLPLMDSRKYSQFFGQFVPTGLESQRLHCLYEFSKCEFLFRFGNFDWISRVALDFKNKKPLHCKKRSSIKLCGRAIAKPSIGMMMFCMTRTSENTELKVFRICSQPKFSDSWDCLFMFFLFLNDSPPALIIKFLFSHRLNLAGNFFSRRRLFSARTRAALRAGGDKRQSFCFFSGKKSKPTAFATIWWRWSPAVKQNCFHPTFRDNFQRRRCKTTVFRCSLPWVHCMGSRQQWVLGSF